MTSSKPCWAEGSALGSLPEQLEIGDSREETFELNALNFVELRRTRFSVIGIPFARQTVWSPVIGKYRYYLDYDDFFDRAGEPALARKQRSIDTWSTVLFWGGFAVTMVGIFMPLALKSDTNDITTTGLVVGSSFVLGGLLISGTSNLMWRPAVPESDAQAIAHRYNKDGRSESWDQGLLGPSENRHGRHGSRWFWGGVYFCRSRASSLAREPTPLHSGGRARVDSRALVLAWLYFARAIGRGRAAT